VRPVAETLTQDKHPIARIRAVREVLDRGLGKPVQRTELTGEGGGDLELRLTRLVAAAEAERTSETTTDRPRAVSFMLGRHD